MIGNFRFWCHKVLPLVYDDSLSYYELLCKVIDYVKKLGEEVNNLVKDLENIKAYVDEYLEKMDIEGIIEDKINELVESGAFDDVFERLSIGNPVSEMQSVYVGDYVLDTTLGLSEYNGDQYGDELLPSAVCKIGAWYLCFNGANTASRVDNYDNYGSYLFASNEVNSIKYGDQTKLERINIGHANSCCYDRVNGKVYVLPLFNYSGTYSSDTSQYTRTTVYKLIRFDIGADNNLPILTNREEITYTLNGTIMGISYNAVNDKIYAYCYDGKIYTYNPSDNTFTFVVQTETIPYLTFNQDFAVYGDTYYISHTRGAVVIGSLVTGKIITERTIARSGLAGYREFGELQGMEFDENGNLYAINSMKVSGTSNTTGGWGVIVGTVINIPTSRIAEEIIENMYTLSNSTFTVNPTTFKSSNTLIKHPCQINILSRHYPIININMATSYAIKYGIWTFYNSVKIMFGSSTIEVSQIEIMTGHLIIANTSGTSRVSLMMSSTNIRNGNQLFIVNGTGRLTIALTDVGTTQADIGIVLGTNRGDYGRLDIGFNFPLTCIRNIPVIALPNGNTGYLKTRADATDASDGVFEREGLYVGSHRVDYWSAES